MYCSKNKWPALEPAAGHSQLNCSVPYRPLWRSSFGALCLCWGGGGLDLCCCGAGAGLDAFCRGGLDWGARGAALSWDPYIGLVPLLPCSWFVGFVPAFLLCEPFAFGFVNGRNPSFALPLFAGVEATRASFGDMAGA